MFDLKPHPLDDFQMKQGFTGLGTLPLAYVDFLKLAGIALERQWVINKFEAYELLEDGRVLRMDASGRMPRSEYSETFAATVREANAYLKLLLAEVEDAHELIYEVWIDDGR